MEGAFRAGPWLVEPQLNLIGDGTRTIHLEPKVMRVLVYLAEHTGEVTNKERLIQAVWPDTFVTDDVLTHAISELRRAFGDDARQPRFIQTVPKGGYRLVAPLQRAPRTVVPSAAEGRVGGPAPLPVPARPWARSRKFRRLAVALTALIGALGGATYWWSRSLTEPRLGRSQQLTTLGRVSGEFLDYEFLPAVVTDGTRLYFTEAGPNTGLRLVSVAGGEVAAIPIPPEVCDPSPELAASSQHCMIDDIAPDGSVLLLRPTFVIPEAPLWTLPAAGGPPRRVGGVTAHAAAWSPDGKKIFFAHGNDLFVASADGSGRRRLVSLPARAFWLRASPDGRRLRFTLRDLKASTHALWEVGADGAEARALLPGWNDPPGECCGSWTPDGAYFLFQSVRGGMMSLWARQENPNLLGGARAPVQLTAGPFRFQTPVASRDGRKIFAVGVQSSSEAVKYDPKSRLFVPFLPGIASGALRFSPDGKWVVEVRPGGMWRMRADGSERIQLISPPMAVVPYLNWSPDSTRIGFPGRLPGKPTQVYVISRDGGSPVPLMPEDRSQTDLDWSPDGSLAVFGRWPAYVEWSMTKEIYIFDLKTGALSTLPGSEGLFSPHWSPDGRHIAAQPITHDKLLLFDVVSRQWKELAHRHAHNPTWSWDGQYIYAQGDGAIWRVRISDGQVEDVASVRDVRRPFTRCEFTGLAPDGSPLAVITYGNADLYAFDWVAP